MTEVQRPKPWRKDPLPPRWDWSVDSLLTYSKPLAEMLLDERAVCGDGDEIRGETPEARELARLGMIDLYQVTIVALCDPTRPAILRMTPARFAAWERIFYALLHQYSDLYVLDMTRVTQVFYEVMAPRPPGTPR